MKIERQTAVDNGSYACYGIAISLALRLHALDLPTDSTSAQAGCIKLFKSCFKAGAALANVLRMMISGRPVGSLDAKQVIMPRDLHSLPSYPQLSKYIVHDVRWYAMGMIESVDYKTDECQHVRSLTQECSPAHGGQELPIDTLFQRCLESETPHILHLELYTTANTEGGLEPEPQHSTLLCSEQKAGKVWHIDTFPTDIRYAKANRPTMTRVRCETPEHICSWFMLTYIPAGTPYRLTASEVTSKSLFSVSNHGLKTFTRETGSQKF